ncbi:hypothetical protein D3C74_304890 [compost metagenome]
MMHVEHQNMAVLLQLDQSNPQQRRHRKIKYANEPAQDLIGFLFVGGLHILHRKIHLRVYPLHRLAIYQFKPGAQCLMTSNQSSECRFEPFPVEHSFQHHRSRHVVALLGFFHLVQNI